MLLEWATGSDNEMEETFYDRHLRLHENQENL